MRRGGRWSVLLPDARALRVYLSASTARADELRGFADDLATLGMEVVSRWLWSAGTIDPGASAVRDLEDLRYADVLVAVTQGTENPHQGRGGRHVELGIAIARGIPVILMGEREHLFHCLPAVQAADDWPGTCDLVGSLDVPTDGDGPAAEG